MTLVAALYVDPRGPDTALVGSSYWDQARDARMYTGPYPVIAHPPCGRWCAMARLNEQRWGAKVGDDGGCFAHAVASVREFGGVLEHPAFSLAWKCFSLPRPAGTAWVKYGNEWVGEVWQSAYGHRATKRTWLLYVGVNSPKPFLPDRLRGSHQIGGGVNTGNRSLPRLPEREAHLSPVAFAQYLVSLAQSSGGAPDRNRGSGT